MASGMKHLLNGLKGSRLEPCCMYVILNFSASTTGCQSGGATFTSKYCGRKLNSLTAGTENVPICGKWMHLTFLTVIKHYSKLQEAGCLSTIYVHDFFPFYNNLPTVCLTKLAIYYFILFQIARFRLK